MTTETLMTDGAQATDPGASSTPAADATQTTAAGADPAASTQQTSNTEAAAEVKPAEAPKTGAPEKYEAFTLPDNALSADEVAKVESLARDLGLTQEAAQKLAEVRAADKAAAAEQTQQALTDARAQWVSAVKADKEIGGDKLAENLATAKKGLQFADPKGEIAKLLEGTGFGDHPEVIRMFHRIGAQISEDRFVPAKGAPSAPQDAASRLYPNQP